MYIHELKTEKIDNDKVIILSVRGNKDTRKRFVDYISQFYSDNLEEVMEGIGMTTLYYDYIPNEQTMADVKRATNEFIKMEEEEINRKNNEFLR